MELETRDDEVEQDSFRAIGADLGAARLEAGMQLQELAQLVRISRHHLKNLEAGDFDLLPGATYVSGYIRTYSREVGLDPVVMTQRYRALLTDREAKPSYSFPVDRQQPQRSGAMMASIMVIFACLGYGGWYAAGKPDLVAALVGEAPQETVAAPQVETTATEPDNLIIQATEQELADAAPAETAPAPETAEAAPEEPLDIPAEDRAQLVEACVADTGNSEAACECAAAPRSSSCRICWEISFIAAFAISCSWLRRPPNSSFECAAAAIPPTARAAAPRACTPIIAGQACCCRAVPETASAAIPAPLNSVRRISVSSTRSSLSSGG